MLSKKALVAQIIQKLEADLAGVTASAHAAHEAATHEESKSEDKHDTRGLEASYLAGAQAQRAQELMSLLQIFRGMDPRDFSPDEAVAPGALVELELQGTARRKTWQFMVPKGGGLSLELEGRTIQVITPQSPMGEELEGRKAGQTIEIETRDGSREYRIVSVK